MKNMCDIDGDVTTIFIEKKNGEKFEFVIDSKDLRRVAQHTWIIITNGRGRIQVISADMKHQLHRYIMGAEKGQQVQFDDGNVFNNRRSNLSIVKPNNSKHRDYDTFSAHKNSKTGVRGVTIDKKTPNKPFRARVIKDQTVLFEKNFATIEEAAKARKEAVERLKGVAI